MKNPNGAGSVYKLSGKRRKPWTVVITVGYDETGKQLRKSCGTFATKKEALVKLSDCIVNYETYKQSVKLNDILLEKIKYQSIASGTIYSYDRCIAKIIKECGNKEVSKFTFSEIQNVINKYEMTPNTVNKIRSILKYAFDQRYITTNFYNKLIPFTNETKKIERIEITEEETENTLRYLIEHKEEKKSYNEMSYYKGAIYLTILTYTGLRIDEFVNLKTKDINFKEKYIRVSKSKTATGLRIIPMPEIVAELFPYIHTNENSEYYISDRETEFEPIPNQRVRFRIQKYSEKFLGVMHNPHDARHTFASRLDRAGVPRSIIQKLMGHTRIDIANVYIHKTLEELTESISKVF